MSRFQGLRRLTICSAMFVLVLAVGCSSPGGLRTSEGASQVDPNEVPFHDGDGTPASSGVGGAAHNQSLKTVADLPFRDPQNLPAGTLLTVRLKTPIAAQNPGVCGIFDAIVDEPVLIEGNTLVPRGASVAGRVESASASRVKRNSGYVRLTLDSIDIAGRDLSLQTASLFARGEAGQTAASDHNSPINVIHLEKGRRLTFRLTEPVYLAIERPPAVH